MTVIGQSRSERHVAGINVWRGQLAWTSGADVWRSEREEVISQNEHETNSTGSAKLHERPASLRNCAGTIDRSWTLRSRRRQQPEDVHSRRVRQTSWRRLSGCDWHGVLCKTASW